jgi:hypothetical protein
MTRRGVSFAEDVRDTSSSKQGPRWAQGQQHNLHGIDWWPGSRSRLRTGWCTPCSRLNVVTRQQSFVGADLHAIMDDHGTLNPLVSRQLSVMSHYRCACGSRGMETAITRGGIP